MHPWRDPGSLKKKKSIRLTSNALLFGDPAGIRTQGPYIKSVLLYQLSYGIIVSLDGGKDRHLLYFSKEWLHFYLKKS